MLTTSGKYLYYNNHRIFYLADTNWGAFSNIEMPDWKYYLNVRKSEGFNSIQINVLRQWDNGEPLKGRNPFSVTIKENGKYDYNYSEINEEYFNQAEKMLDEMAKRKMIPSLVLLWGNYVPGTWMRGMSPNNVMSFDQIKSYVKYVVNRFKRFHPLWIMSGDVGFGENEGPDPAIVKKYYQEVLNVAKTEDPDGVFAFHISGGSTYLPPEFLKKINVFLYQSGHAIKTQDTSYSIPQKLRKLGFGGPIIDAELCYEEMIKIGKRHLERYDAYDVRKAAWQAVLSGADAGLGYGAFGIWPWTDYSRPKTLAKNIFTRDLKPFDWHLCLNLKGAKDLGFLHQLINRYTNTELKSIDFEDKSFFVAENDKYLLIYLPTNDYFDFSKLNASVNQCKVIDLNTNEIREGIIRNNILQIGSSLKDKLIIVNRREGID